MDKAICTLCNEPINGDARPFNALSVSGLVHSHYSLCLRTLRTALTSATERAERAETALSAANEAHARHAADRSREVTELHRAHERALRRAEQAEAEVARYKEREAHFATVLGVTDRGQYRADWDSRIRRLCEERDHYRAEVARLREELRLANIDIGINKAEAEARTSEAATLANEVARLRGEYERGLREAAGMIVRTADTYDRTEFFFALGPAAQAERIKVANAIRAAANSVLAMLDAKEGGG